MTKEQISQIAEKVVAGLLFAVKDILSLEEAAQYIGVEKNYMYKLTHERKIPHYKPNGKMCYFKRAELEEWLMSNPVATKQELEQEAQAYCFKNPLKKT